MSDITEAPLNIRTAVLLADLIAGVQRSETVEWSDDGGETIRTGTLRAIVNAEGGFLGPDQDVRTANVRITTSTGMEIYPLVRGVLGLLDTHYMFIAGTVAK